MTHTHLLIRLHRQLDGRRKRQLAGVLVLMLLGAVAEVMTLGALVPFIAVMSGSQDVPGLETLRRMFDLIGRDDPDRLLSHVTVLFAGAALTAGLVRVVLTRASYGFVYGLGNDLGARVYSNILYQPYVYHLTNSSSEIVGAINKVQVVTNNVILHLMRAIVAVTIASFILVALLVIDPLIAFSCLLGIGAIFVVVRLLTARYLRRNSRVISDMQSKRVQVVLEGVGGIRDVLIDRAEPLFADKFRQYDKLFQDANMANFSMARAPRYVVEALGMTIIAVTAWLIAGRSGSAVAVLPTLAVLAVGAQRLLPLMQDIYQAWAHITGNGSVLGDVLTLLEMPVCRERLRPAPAAEAGFRDRIVLDDVGFRYGEARNDILRNISLEIPKGAAIGLIGRTGSGKSSLVDLIMGLLTPTAGSIRIDDRELSRETAARWQNEIAHVPQAIFLQDASIAQNIAFGADPGEIDPDRVKAAAAQAQIAGFVDTLPEGYRTVVGERGVRLSGGQRQRIGIARALYKRAGVLVLDEATSALDTETEAAVMNAIRQRADDLTIIVIAHRLSTVSLCDRVIRLEDGEIAAIGTYEEIVATEPSDEARSREGTVASVAMAM